MIPIVNLHAAYHVGIPRSSSKDLNLQISSEKQPERNLPTPSFITIINFLLEEEDKVDCSTRSGDSTLVARAKVIGIKKGVTKLVRPVP